MFFLSYRLLVDLAVMLLVLSLALFAGCPSMPIWFVTLLLLIAFVVVVVVLPMLPRTTITKTDWMIPENTTIDLRSIARRVAIKCVKTDHKSYTKLQ